jgi:hypothetical protein
LTNPVKQCEASLLLMAIAGQCQQAAVMPLPELLKATRMQQHTRHLTTKQQPSRHSSMTAARSGRFGGNKPVDNQLFVATLVS